MLINSEYPIAEGTDFPLGEYKTSGVMMNTAMLSDYASLSKAVGEKYIREGDFKGFYFGFALAPEKYFPSSGAVPIFVGGALAGVVALSGVEAVANMTGIMVPPVGRTSGRAIWVVLAEIVVFNLIFAVAMTSLPDLPADILATRSEGALTPHDVALRDTMLRVLAEARVGPWFAMASSLVFALLLLSAVNTAIGGMISLQYTLARDGELPPLFVRLNAFGVPWVPLAAACGVCAVVLMFARDVEELAHLYAVGVVGAILINLASASFNPHITLKRIERAGLLVIALVLLAIEVTIIWQKPAARLFAAAVMAAGYLLRAAVNKAPALTQHIPRLAGTVSSWFEEPPLPESAAAPPAIPFDPARPKILVASRGGNPALIDFAADEAARRGANLLVLFVRELVIAFGPSDVVQDPERDADAAMVFAAARQAAQEKQVPLMPIYCVSPSTPDMILDFAGTYGVDFVILGVSRRGALTRAIRGDVITRVASYLPPETTLLIHA